MRVNVKALSKCEIYTYNASQVIVASLCLFSPDFSAHSKKSTEQMKKVPTIVLSVSYKGVKFIDATNKVAHAPKISQKCPRGGGGWGWACFLATGRRI